MTTPAEDPRITAYLFDELDEVARREFEAELKSSPELRRELEQLGGVVKTLQGELSSEQTLQLNDEQRSRVQEAIGTADSEVTPAAKPMHRTRRRVWLGVAGLGAIAALFVFFIPMFQHANYRELAQQSAPLENDVHDWLQAGTPTSSSEGGAIVSSPDSGQTVTATTDNPMDMMGVDVIVTEEEETGFERGLANDERLRGSGISIVKRLGDSGAVSGTVTATGQVMDGVQDESRPLAAIVPKKKQRRKKLPTEEDFIKSFGGEPFSAPTDATLPVSGAGPDIAGKEVTGFGLGGGGLGGGGGGRGGPLPGYLGEDKSGVVQLQDRFAQEELDRGRGPGEGGDKYDLIVENEFLSTTDEPLSTFSIDVDTASYAKVRMFLREHGRFPRPDAVRIEELVNYFPYEYEPPSDEHPFAARQAVAVCPWNSGNKLVRIAIKGKEIDHEERPASNLVFLLDVSGSMNQPNKMPLLQRGMTMLAEQLTENDRVAIVVYAGAAGMVLDSTTGDQQKVIIDSLSRLKAGGSTNGGAGIQLAYQTALDHFIPGGTNRVILCTDGDFNVGTTGTDELIRMVEDNAKTGVFLSVIGFGMGNHNDSMLEQVSNKGNGNYAFVDTESEARKVLVDQMVGTLVTIAKDVKIQVEFNPAKVEAYRLIGYENRILAAQDFNDDKKDAGEIGAGHTVTALYEVVPKGGTAETAPPVDPLKYQNKVDLTDAAHGNELLTLKLRYKQPEADTSELLTFPLEDSSSSFQEADREFQFAAAVASFGMLLRKSKYAGNSSFDAVLEIATPAAQNDATGYRTEFLDLVRKAVALSK